MRSLRLRRISHVLSSSRLFPSASASSLLPTVSSEANNAGRQERGVHCTVLHHFLVLWPWSLDSFGDRQTADATPSPGAKCVLRSLLLQYTRWARMGNPYQDGCPIDHTFLSMCIRRVNKAYREQTLVLRRRDKGRGKREVADKSDSYDYFEGFRRDSHDRTGVLQNGT